MTVFEGGPLRGKISLDEVTKMVFSWRDWCPYKKKRRHEEFCLVIHWGEGIWGHIEEEAVAYNKARSHTSGDTKCGHTLTSDFSASRTVRNSMLWICPVCGILLQQPKLTKTISLSYPLTHVHSDAIPQNRYPKTWTWRRPFVKTAVIHCR